MATQEQWVMTPSTFDGLDENGDAATLRTERFNYSTLISQNRQLFFNYLKKTKGYPDDVINLVLDMCQVFNVNPAAITVSNDDSINLSITISYHYLLAKILQSGLIDYIEINIHKGNQNEISGGECIIKRKDMSKEFRTSLRFEEVAKANKIWQKEKVAMFRKALLMNAVKIACADLIEPYMIFNTVNSPVKKEPQTYTQPNQNYQQNKAQLQSKTYSSAQQADTTTTHNKSTVVDFYTKKIKELVDVYPNQETYKKIGAMAREYVKNQNISNYEEATIKIYNIMYNAYKNVRDGIIDYEDIINGSVSIADLLEG